MAEKELRLGYVRGRDGKSPYDAAKEQGYTGTEEEFNTALAGMQSAPFLPLAGGMMDGSIQVKGQSKPLAYVDFNHPDQYYAAIYMGVDGNESTAMSFVVKANDGKENHADTDYILRLYDTNESMPGSRGLGIVAGNSYTIDKIKEPKNLTTKEYVDSMIGDINTVLDTINGEVV